MLKPSACTDLDVIDLEGAEAAAHRLLAAAAISRAAMREGRTDAALAALRRARDHANDARTALGEDDDAEK